MGLDHSLALSRFPGDLRLGNRATGTIQLYVGSIRRFDEFLGQPGIHQTSGRPSVKAIGRASRLGQHHEYAVLKFLHARTPGQPEGRLDHHPRSKAHLPSIPSLSGKRLHHHSIGHLDPQLRGDLDQPRILRKAVTFPVASAPSLDLQQILF